MTMQLPGSAQFRDRFPLLARHSNASDLDALLDCLHVRTVESGEVLVTEGSDMDCLYLVWDGELRCSLREGDEEQEIGRVSQGQYVGEVSVLDPGPATATVVAETPCTLLEMSREKFESLGQTHPIIRSRLIKAMIAVLIERLRSSDHMLYQAFGDEDAQPQDARLSRVFQGLFTLPGRHA